MPLILMPASPITEFVAVGVFHVAVGDSDAAAPDFSAVPIATVPTVWLAVIMAYPAVAIDIVFAASETEPSTMASFASAAAAIAVSVRLFEAPVFALLEEAATGVV